MKLAAWAERQGIASCTAWRWVRQDRISGPWSQTASGTILVDEPTPAAASASGPVALRARLSSNDQKHDLERRLGRLTEDATRNGMTVVRSVAESGSGLSGHRPKLRRLLVDPLVLVEASEMRDDVVQDLIDVLTSFCARLYGRRSAKRHAQRAVAALEPR